MAANDLIYVNADVCAAADGVPVPCVYNEYRTQPIVARASDYRLSVLRWQAQNLELPLFIPAIKTGQNDPNLTVYQVRVTNTGTNASAAVNVRWVPQYGGEMLPPSPFNGQILQGRYYWASSYAWVVTLFNTALATAAASVGVAAPVMTYDADTQTFSFTVAAGSTIALNRPSVSLLDHFNFSYGADGFATPIPDASGAYEQFKSSTDAWTPISSIVITTLMPIAPEESSAPARLGFSDFSMDASCNYENQLTDMALEWVGGASDSLGAITYFPAAQLRYTNLVSPEPLQSIQFALYWKNRNDGALYPCRLKPSGSVSIKFLLQRRW